MHYYQFHIGDYHAHTAHLDELEDLAYRRMLDYCYLNECGLPETIEDIARVIRMRTHCERIATVLREFFYLADDGTYRSKRVEIEIGRVSDKSEKAAESARLRWEKERKQKENADANAMRTQCERNAIQDPISNTQDPISNTQEPIPNAKTLAVAKAPAAPSVKAVKIGFDYETAVWSGLQENPELIASWQQAYPAVDLRSEFNKMRAWLKSNPANRKTNLTKFINNWLSKAQDRAGSPAHKTFAEREQEYKDQKAKEFYQPLFDMTEEELVAWGFKTQGESSD